MIISLPITVAALLGALLNAAAGFLLKSAAIATSTNIWQQLQNPRQIATLFMALSAYGLAFLCYGYILRSIPISIAYPVVTALSAIIIVTIACLFFHEPFTLRLLAGIALVIIGIALLGSYLK